MPPPFHFDGHPAVLIFDLQHSGVAPRCGWLAYWALGDDQNLNQVADCQVWAGHPHRTRWWLHRRNPHECHEVVPTQSHWGTGVDKLDGHRGRLSVVKQQDAADGPRLDVAVRRQGGSVA